MKLLWVSRHDMTAEQLTALHNIFGEVEVVQYDKTVNDLSEIVSRDIDVYAVVFPTDKLLELYSLVKDKARIITPQSERCATGGYVINPATGKKETEYVFQHKHWIEYKKIEADIAVLD